MENSAMLIKEIENLPSKYYGEVLNFVGYLQQKAQNEIAEDAAAYKAMAADAEREQEAIEWCNACFGPVGGME
jgi:hypothetical protein